MQKNYSLCKELFKKILKLNHNNFFIFYYEDWFMFPVKPLKLLHAFCENGWPNNSRFFNRRRGFGVWGVV